MSAPKPSSVCQLDACKVCSACVYSRHQDCAATVQCPTTLEVSTCRCCGVDKLRERAAGGGS